MKRRNIEDIAQRLAVRISHRPVQLVVYIEQGASGLGVAVAKALNVPVVGLDISYPLSRTLNRAPRFLRAMAWPIKEVTYRFTSPRRNASLPSCLSDAYRIALIDDTASTGRTLKAAIRVLADAGIDRDRITTAVIRCGKQALPLVDCFETTDRVRFK
ncbi:MAG: phosphoribosyltransferase [Myxococcota bacterium]|nr:phosphoribosyltransferase [Myxococcota bacterium]